LNLQNNILVLFCEFDTGLLYSIEAQDYILDHRGKYVENNPQYLLYHLKNWEVHGDEIALINQDNIHFRISSGFELYDSKETAIWNILQQLQAMEAESYEAWLIEGQQNPTCDIYIKTKFYFSQRQRYSLA